MENDHVQRYEKIQSELAVFRSGEAIRNVSDSLKPMRPPTAPDSDIERESCNHDNCSKKHVIDSDFIIYSVFMSTHLPSCSDQLCS